VVGELTRGGEVLRWVSGDAASFGLKPGGWVEGDQSYCRLLADDELPAAVPDARAEPRVRDLAVTREAGIGSFVGVVLEPFDARLFALCCLAHEPRPGLGEADVRFLRGLGETVVATLEAAQAGERGWAVPLEQITRRD
jgi:GAF domain-containing protein